MTLTKKTILTIIGIFILQFAIAQNTMKEPISFKLKNGITIIVAENMGMGKVYASLTTDHTSATKEGVAQSLDKLLNAKAKQCLAETFGEVNKRIVPSVKFVNAEANVSSDVNDFNTTFSIMSSALQNININENTVSKNISIADVKAFYNQQFVPSKTIITIAGDITVSQAKLLVKKVFGDLKDQDFIASR